MDWNNDGKYDWKDYSMDMYVMDQSKNDSGMGGAHVNFPSMSKAICFIILWIMVYVVLVMFGAI